MKTKIKQGMEAAHMTRLVTPANQNIHTVVPSYNAPLWSGNATPQWYDIKFMIEHMFDLRSQVRDAIAERREAEQVRRIYAGHPAQQIVHAEIYGHNMRIALAWHEYKKATAAYHTAWAVYLENLKNAR